MTQAAVRYSTIAIVLHWLIALALAFELALGFAMPKESSGFALWQLHKSVGVAILLLTLARIGWRVFNRPPEAVEASLMGRLARTAHGAFYAFMLLAPLTGWAMVSTSSTRIPTVLFGIVRFPDLPLPASWSEPLGDTHEILAWIGLALIALHVAGVVRHDLLLRHGSLGRMAPGGRPALGVLLGFAVLCVGVGTYGIVARRPSENAGVRPEPVSAPVPEATPARVEPVPVAVEPTQPAQALPEWSIRPGGRLSFSVANGAEAISGSFARWGGTIRFDPDSPERADIRIEIDLASASVGDATQDQMLAGDEYFAVAAHPRAVMRIAAARKTGSGSYSAHGTLQLKGASLPQALEFRLTGTGPRRHVEGRAAIARMPFAIGTGETGGNLGPAVQVRFSFDADMQTADRKLRPD